MDYTFIYVDMIGSSSDKSIDLQINKLKDFMDLAEKVFRDPSPVYLSFTGDGFVVVYKNFENAFEAAIGIHQTLNTHNNNNLNLNQKDKEIKVRMGIAKGEAKKVFPEETETLPFDIPNPLWGRAMIMAQRYMEKGNADHVLVEKSVVQDIKSHYLPKKYAKSGKEVLYDSCFTPMGKFSFKHNLEYEIYNFYNENETYYTKFGNKDTSDLKRDIPYIVDRVINTLDFSKANSKHKNIVHFTRQVKITNLSDYDLTQKTHTLSAPGKSRCRRVDVYRIENKKQVPLYYTYLESSISETQEMIVQFDKPIGKNQSVEYYIKYDYNYENADKRYSVDVLTDVRKFEIVFIYPKTKKLELEDYPKDKITTNKKNISSKNQRKIILEYDYISSERGKFLEFKWNFD